VQRVVVQKRGPGCITVCIAAVLVLWAIGSVSKCQRDSTRSKADDYIAASAMPEPVAPTSSGSNATARQAAVGKFTGLPAVKEASWVRDDEFWVLVEDNGKSWDAVADQACAWIRSQGYSGAFSVSVLDASAAANKRAKQLAHAGCR
jgi:hypothetical protein